MAEHIHKCPKCETYTMEKICPKCTSPTYPPKPAKFSPEDPYGDYRRKAKKEEHEKEDLV